MDTEWEAKFLDIDKGELRNRLKFSGAKLVKPETLYKRAVFSYLKDTRRRVVGFVLEMKEIKLQ